MATKSPLLPSKQATGRVLFTAMCAKTGSTKHGRQSSEDTGHAVSAITVTG